MPGSGRFTTHIQQVGAFAHHAEALRDRRLRVSAQTVATERVRRDIDDSHHIGASAPFEAAGTDFRDHEPIILRLDMKLADLARGAGAVLEGNGEVEVTGIAYDSRRVSPGDLFVAVQGLHVDGHVYITEAVAQGAVAVAIERYVKVAQRIPVLHVPSTRTGLAELAAEFYGRPSRGLKLAGVTGTDGKTTVTHMAEHVLQASGIVAGAMSTVAFKVSGREVDNVSGQTTTEAPEVQAWLARMVEAGAACAVLETTSHALVQERVHACDFDVAAFTNVGHDHLDYHATWEEYLEAKARLIDLAHAAGSLASALAELRPFTRGRLIAVFGSTARSDHDRPGMGRAAAEFSDFFIITTDDPLSEDPAEIARDVQAGAEGKAPGRDFEVVIDRRAAIRRAIEVAQTGDTVLLAGKGHERSMRTARGSEPWDERAEAEAAIKERLAVG